MKVVWGFMVWTPEQGKEEKEYFTNEGYETGGIFGGFPIQGKKFVIPYKKEGKDFLGFVCRYVGGGKRVSYELHLYKLIKEDSDSQIKKRWIPITGFEISKESKLGKDLLELEEERLL